MPSYAATIATTWAINFDEIICESIASADLLRVIAFLSPDDIPLEFIISGADKLSGFISSALENINDDPVALDELVEPLTRYSLARRNIDTHMLSTYRMVQEVMRKDMTSDECRMWMERVVRATDKCFLMPTEFEHWPFCERLIPHALLAVHYCEEEQLQTKSPGHLQNRLGCYLSDQARYSEAALLLDQALERRKQSLDAKHPFIAETLSNLGLLLERQGNYSRAEQFHREALSIVKDCGNEQEAAAENNLASTLMSLGQFAEAEQGFRRCIELKSISGDHASYRLSLTMVNLASLRVEFGDLVEANSLS